MFVQNILTQGLSPVQAQLLQSAKVLVVGDMSTAKTIVTNLCVLNVGTVKIWGNDSCNSFENFLQNSDSQTKIYDCSDVALAEVVCECDIVVDCILDLQDKLALNLLAVKFGVPFVFASMHNSLGQVAFLKSPQTPCLECLYQKETSFSAKKLQSDYLSNPISALQSDMVVRWILGFDDVLDGCMLTYDSAEMKFNKIVLAKKQDCPVC